MLSVSLPLLLYCLRSPRKSIAELGLEHSLPETHSPFLLVKGPRFTEIVHCALPSQCSKPVMVTHTHIHAHQTLDQSWYHTNKEQENLGLFPTTCWASMTLLSQFFRLVLLFPLHGSKLSFLEKPFTSFSRNSVTPPSSAPFFCTC